MVDVLNDAPSKVPNYAIVINRHDLNKKQRQNNSKKQKQN